jgi:L-lactate oxidase
MVMKRRDLLLSGLGATATLTAAKSVFSLNRQNSDPPALEEAPMPGSGGSSDISAYLALTNEKDIQIVNLRELEDRAREILPPYSFAYIAGGSGDEWTMDENDRAFNRWVIEPKFLSGVKVPDLSTEILGTRLSLPVIAAPMGGQGIAHARKEIPNVRGTHESGTLYVNTSVSHLSMEEIAENSDGPKWFQIYFPADPAYARELLHRAKASGYTAIVITIDTTTFSNRERPVRLGVPMPNLGSGNGVRTPGIDAAAARQLKIDLTWDDVAFCREETGLPVIVKGILTPALAEEAVKRGCAGVWISNHGGRALDNTSAAVSVLPRIAKAVEGKALIIIDGGVRRGQDVFRALALGADVTAIGRPLLYAMALGGSRGVRSVYARLRTELEMVMQLAGVPDIKGITHEYVRAVPAEMPGTDVRGGDHGGNKRWQ